MAREAEQELQQKVHRHRLDEGLRALRELVMMRRDAVNASWIDSAGEELLQYQGEARALRKLLRLMDEQPIKQGE
jgi:hypothetical protein